MAGGRSPWKCTALALKRNTGNGFLEKHSIFASTPLALSPHCIPTRLVLPDWTLTSISRYQPGALERSCNSHATRNEEIPLRNYTRSTSGGPRETNLALELYRRLLSAETETLAQRGYTTETETCTSRLALNTPAHVDSILSRFDNCDICDSTGGFAHPYDDSSRSAWSFMS